MIEVSGDKLNLRRLILLLCLFTAFITLINAFYSMYRVQRELIITNTLASNQVYAEKMAEMTDAFLTSALNQLAFSAAVLSDKIADPELLLAETERLKQQTDSFNSVVVVNADGVIKAIAPQTLPVTGIALTGVNSLQSLTAQKPLITDPFVSPAGNYITSISYPIFSASGHYQGFVSGTIYLEQENMLATLLGKHSYRDGSYLYVVDHNRTLVYHPDHRRIGQVITKNAAINAVARGESGHIETLNVFGTEMLAGYAPVKQSGWGIVAQKPRAEALMVLDDQLLQVVWQSIPIGIVTLIIIWISAIFISKPLWQLASAVKKLESDSSLMDEMKLVKPWYFEAAHLKQSFLRAFGVASNTIDRLQSDSLTDAMTGLLNRRGLEKSIESFTVRQMPFSVLALDLDYFKKVNDTYGHDAGDELLREVSSLMKQQAREQDIVCRAGGEEFILLLSNTHIARAYEVAERIRASVANHSFTMVPAITISIGVAYWSAGDEAIESVMKKADMALYQAKHNGRNRTEMSDC
ncbi:sensor domain-containing diguanylate cyclase [Vibrio sp. ABG19]|uniref:sensor domain-containing diguanylate cyclase n=1 Tax=Vibrio sp. ABG19 TaxID=2817385 RepID=UPI00249EFDA8|nr:sensor domain-containing diguanylate cyclase [Vibrio sp. ABG19]WGY47930.1 GGDEF domain-containing protein [Vibrio sp. ABG19]